MLKNAHLSVIASAFVALAAPAAAQDADTVLARVGTAEITLGHVIALRGQLPLQFAGVPDATLFPAIVDQLIEQEVLAQTLADTLPRRTQLMLDNQTRSFLATTALVGAVEAAVTDETIATAYAAFVANFATGEPVTEYNAAHILVTTAEDLEQVTSALAAGRPFAEVAAEFSIDGSAQDGGDLGWFPAGLMIDDFQAAVEALEPGQISEPLQTQFGFHVINLLGVRTATAPSLDEVRDEIVENLQRETSRAIIAQLRAATTTENLSEGFDPALLSRADLLDE